MENINEILEQIKSEIWEKLDSGVDEDGNFIVRMATVEEVIDKHKV